MRLWQRSMARRASGIPQGIWRGARARQLYTWRLPLRVAAWLGLILATILLTPLVVLLAGLLVYLVGFLFEMLRLEAGRALVSGYSAWLQTAFAGENLPTSVPRLAVVAFTVILFVLAIGGVLAGRAIGSRRAERGWWWRIVAAPFDAHVACDRFAEAIWELIRGAAPVARPSMAALGTALRGGVEREPRSARLPRARRRDYRSRCPT